MAPKSIRRGLMIGLMVGTMAVTGVPAVSAATGAVAGKPADPVAESAGDLVATRGAALAGGHSHRIHCRVHATRPHLLRHGHGHGHGHGHHRRLIKMAGHIRCNHRVKALRIKVSLYRNGRFHGSSGWRGRHHARHVGVAIARKCHRHGWDDRSRLGGAYYKGKVWAKVVYPHGYNPARRSTIVTTRTVWLRCH
ncbi:hypothetical protein [Thermomonospora umbrina]|uniref:Secreted protein n=1 Tax=Thermomonospora umbrina TaxID=111806 RepID=A0A3D9T641_9ACTN|nr:hypothetical protein [Thermomonospora umbrina]REE99221.1 hypothetical protein DFJ69_4729 [Thermomonospora umbrina]